MAKYVMALDAGTTSNRCILFDEKGRICSVAQKEFTQYFSQPGWVEHDADEIWSTQLGVAVEAMSKIGAEAGDIAAIGITNQRETVIVWDKATGRPVYNANYNSTLFNFRDTEVEFEYKEFDQLELVENTFTSNLTAVLAYYAYIIIGYDMDSFSRLGGTPYFQMAENLVSTAQSTDYAGWKAEMSSPRNRYALVNNLMDEAFKDFRNYFYEYHRLGLDEMSTNVTNGVTRIAEGLPLVREANRARPNGAVVTVFMDSKTDELVNIFSGASQEQKQAAVEVLSDIAPTRSADWERITNSD